MDKTQSINEDESNAISVTEPKEGETGIIRNKESAEKLFAFATDMPTVLDLFEHNFENKKDITIGFIKHTTKESYVEKKFTYSSMQNVAKAYSLNLHEKKLYTEVELDSKMWRFMGIYCKNIPSWMAAYLGHMYNDITTVSIYDTFGIDGLEYIFNLTQMKTIVVQSLFLKRIREMHEEGKLKYIKNLIVCDIDLDSLDYENEHSEYLRKNNLSLINLKDFINEGEELVKSNKDSLLTLTRCKPQSISVVSFTSGSTGIPKGALLSHQAITNQALSILNFNDLGIAQGDTHFSYLPYAHVFEQVFFSLTLYTGVNVVYYSGDPAKLGLDIKITKPDFLPAVPRVLLRFYDMINMKLNSFTGWKRLVMRLAFREKLKMIQTEKKFDHFIFDKLFFDEIKEMVFGRKDIKFILTGSAPIDGKVLDFFKVVFGCPVIEAYGLTETVGALTLTGLTDPMSGHIGFPLVCSEFKLLDVPELNYFTTDIDQETGKPLRRGEIWARSQYIFEGYLCLKEETDNMVDKDGWIHTGDIGQLLDGNRLKIIDRRKNIFKLSQAEYIAPEKIENVMKLCPYIIQSWIYGKSTENYVVALIVLDVNSASKLSSNLKIQFQDPNELLTNGTLISFLIKEIEQTCRSGRLASFEIPKKILLTYNQFSIENGLLTVTMKAMRTNIRKEWEKKVAILYDL